MWTNASTAAALWPGPNPSSSQVTPQSASVASAPGRCAGSRRCSSAADDQVMIVGGAEAPELGAQRDEVPGGGRGPGAGHRP